MKNCCLEVTYRKGRLLAAYYYLPRRDGDRSVRTSRAGPGLLVDYAPDGRPIGIEMTAPSSVDLAQVNRLLKELGQTPVRQEDLGPLVAA